MTQMLNQTVTASLSPEEKRRLLAQLLQKGAKEGRSNLSIQQHRLWLLRKVDPTVPTHVSAAFHIRGHLNVVAFRHCICEVLRRHEDLRTSFVDLEARPVRVVAPDVQVELPVIDLTGHPHEHQNSTIQTLALKDARKPFDLASPPLTRFTMVSLAPNEQVLLITMHEIVTDDCSVTIFMHEVAALYESLVNGRNSPLPRLEKQFSDFVRWQREWLQSEQFADQLDYWRKQLAGVPVLELPTDRPRPALRTHNGAVMRQELGPDVVERLEQLGQQEGATLLVTLLTIYQMLLAWYSRQEDIAVGVPVTGRKSEAWEGLIGPLANTLVMRADLSRDPSFTELLRRVQKVVLEASEQQEMPFDKLVDELQPQRDLSRTPIFQARFVMQEAPPAPIELSFLTMTPLETETGSALYDLTLLALRTSHGLRLVMQYNADLFDEATIERMLGHLKLLSERVVADPEQRLSQMSSLPKSERRRLLVDWNNTQAAYPAGKCLHHLFEEQAERTPNEVAIIFENEQLTYSQLNHSANRLAHHLLSLGVGPESRVGLFVERSTQMVVALLAILKACGAYVPLDPSYPSDRIEFMVRDSNIELLLTQQHLRERLPRLASTVVCIDNECAEIASLPCENPVHIINPDHLAYVIYTSGSTAAPKGVMVPHRGVVNNLWWRQNTWPLTACDRVLQNYSFSFDPSVWATFWPLMAGAKVVLARPAKHFDSSELVRLMAKQSITVYGAAPSLHTVLMEEPDIAACHSLRYVLSGGEVLSADLQDSFFRNLQATLCNLYGPTESSIDATYWLCPRVDQPTSAPIGRPLANLQTYLLDTQLEPVPIGVAGELYIGGVGLARGYHNRADLTAEKFLPDPFSREPGSRLYRSGDLARYRPDGAMEFIGRADDQVKVRGFRIELNEIEAVLAQVKGVNEAVVTVSQDIPGNGRLVAYVVCREESRPSQDEIVTFLEQRLPHYTVPGLFVFLDELPRTPNGKLNRKALPAPEIEGAGPEGDFVEARTPLERELAEAFASVLGVERVSINENFFSVGGNSLLVARLATRLSTTYDVDLPVHQIFKEPTVAGVAQLIEIYNRNGAEGVMGSWTLTQLETEAALDPTITPEGLPLADFLSPRHIFLTGATGYLGAFLLERILKETDADVYCLVRASGPDDLVGAFKRIQSTLELYRIWDSSFAPRVHPVVGDLAKPLLGLSPSQFSELAARVDTIYHSGALVNFVYPYSALKAPNVLGTQEVLRLACQQKLKAVHYISTIDVLLAVHAPRPFLENDDPLKQPAAVPDGYPRSKWVAEKIVSIARARGIPVCVYRPGLIMSHTETGATQTNDYLLVGLKGYLELGVLPEPDIMIDIIPVDYAAKAVVEISRQQESIGKYFHLWNSKPIHMSQAYDWVKSFGYQLDVLPFGDVRERLVSVDSSSPLYPFVPMYRRLASERLVPAAFDPNVLVNIDSRDECRNTLESLKSSGIECPPLSENLAHLCFAYLIDIGFLPPSLALA